MTTRLEVLFSPAEFLALSRRDLRETTCVVLDILRATTSIITALGHGAEAIHPVATLDEALALRRAMPDALLAGERDGRRIRAALTGGTEFDLGNSPREFTAERIRGRHIVMTTTNGTRALTAAAKARRVLVGSFLNLEAIARRIARDAPRELIVICSGTYEEAALEDTLAAGAICDRLWSRFEPGHVADSAVIARDLYLFRRADLPSAMEHARNGRRLLASAELRDDVAFALQRDTVAFTAELCAAGTVRRAPSAADDPPVLR